MWPISLSRIRISTPRASKLLPSPLDMAPLVSLPSDHIVYGANFTIGGNHVMITIHAYALFQMFCVKHKTLKTSLSRVVNSRLIPVLEVKEEN